VAVALQLYQLKPLVVMEVVALAHFTHHHHLAVMVLQTRVAVAVEVQMAQPRQALAAQAS
jgi:hypothetical protein